MPHPLAVDQSAIHDEGFDKAFMHGLDHLIDEFIEDGALMAPTGNYAGCHHKKKVQLAVDMDQAHQFVAAVLLISLIAAFHLVATHGGLVLIKPPHTPSLSLT